MSTQNSAPLTLTYINLRKIVGLLAMALPLVIFLAELVFFETEFQTSISAYYYTKMRWYFILTLGCIGFFLFFYQGYDNLDKWIARVAGLAAFLTAIFPISNPNSAYCASPLFILNPTVEALSTTYRSLCSITETIHLLSEATMFIAVAIFLLFRFTKCEHGTESIFEQCKQDSNGNPRNTVQRIFCIIFRGTLESLKSIPRQCEHCASDKKKRNRVYKILGGVIAVSIPIMGLSFLWEDFFAYTVYLGEFIALVAFGISWAVKGEWLWLRDAAPSQSSQRFNVLQSRQVDGYKSGMGVFVFLVAIWFTTLLYAAQVVPFNLFVGEAGDSDTVAGELLRLGFHQADAQKILMVFLFALVAIVIYFILNNQVLSLFWPLVRRNFRVELGQDKDKASKNEELWTLFSSQVNELGLSPRFSVNPRAETAVTVPSTLTPDSSYLGTFFDLLNWIFPRLGYSLRMTRMSSEILGAGVSLSLVKNDRKEVVAEKTFWASTYKIDTLKEVNDGDDLRVYHLLMIPAYFWFTDVVDRLDGFNPDPRVWEARAYNHLGNALWHSDLVKGVYFFTNSINMDQTNWPAYAALGRVWIEKSQESEEISPEISREYVLLANSYLDTAIHGFRQDGIDQVYFSALYNKIVAMFYLSNGKDYSPAAKDELLRLGYKYKEETLATFLILQGKLLQRKSGVELLHADLSKEIMVLDLDLEKDQQGLQAIKDSCARISHKIVQQEPNNACQQMKCSPLGGWLVNFLPALEFVLLILELETANFKGGGARKPSFAKYKDTVEAWVDDAVGRFADLPYCDEPVNMNRPFLSGIEAEKARRHFMRSHYRIQFNAACFYSMLVTKVKEDGFGQLVSGEGKDGLEYMDLALDHLEMALGVSGGLVHFAKKDSALESIRDEERYKVIVGEKKEKDTVAPGNDPADIKG